MRYSLTIKLKIRKKENIIFQRSEIKKNHQKYSILKKKFKTFIYANTIFLLIEVSIVITR